MIPLEKQVYFDDYVKKLLQKRDEEEIKEDIYNEFHRIQGGGLSSPTTAMTMEETRLFNEYIERANLFTISEWSKQRGKALKLRSFFTSKRFQQVEILVKGSTTVEYLEGKVSAVGRDFVMLTNLQRRIWVPYEVIESANIPYGVPHYSHTHHHILFDNDLRRKLLTQFGATVARRETLKQQFFQEKLQTNLHTWKDSLVTVYFDDNKKEMGKISGSQANKLYVTFFGDMKEISLDQVIYIKTIRFYSLWTKFVSRWRWWK